MIVDYVPEEKLGDAIIALDNLLEFNEETKQALREAMDMDNLLGPYESFDEMVQDALNCEDGEEDQEIQCAHVKAV